MDRKVIWIQSVSWPVTWKGGAFWGLGGMGVVSSWWPMDGSSDGGIWGGLCVRGVGGFYGGIVSVEADFLAIAQEWGVG